MSPVSDTTPTPKIPSPAALAARMAPRPSAPATPPPTVDVTHSESARFGRVDDDGHVFVTVGEQEREVGSYPGATPEEALQYFARKYDEHVVSAELLEARVGHAEVSAKELSESLTSLREHVEAGGFVGDIPALEATVARIGEAIEVRRAQEAEEHAAARAQAQVARERIVVDAEAIAAQPPGSTQWKQSGERMRALLDEWKSAQRSGPKLSKSAENELWQRFSAARNSFDKARRTWFAQLEGTRAEAKEAKEALVAEAEALATSTDWAHTARSFKQLMDRWRAAGRAGRADDDSLWERFRAAQDSFFAAKDEVVAAENEEFTANLAVKEALLVEAEALLPVTDLEAAKTALRGIQDRWDEAGKVPRADLERVEKRMRRVESAVREADEKRWRASNPEAAARARSLADQLEASVSSAEADLAAAEAAGDSKRAAKAKERLEAQRAWLTQAQASIDEFGG